MEKPLRIFTLEEARLLCPIIDRTFPFEGFIPKMVKQGVYVILDSSGRRMPTEQAVMELRTC